MEYRELANRLGYLELLRRIYAHKAASSCNIYFGQLPILEYVKRHDGCTQRELADFLHVSPPSVATSVKRMQRAGLLFKTVDANDLRYTRLSVTPKGIRCSEDCRSRFNEIEEKMFAGLDENEQSQLSGLLQRMIDNLAVDGLENMDAFALIEEADRLKKNVMEEDTVGAAGQKEEKNG